MKPTTTSFLLLQGGVLVMITLDNIDKANAVCLLNSPGLAKLRMSTFDF
jgi:hypothetical protein